ncbi:type IV toxin-antitoxin system AbiEi family antitoxin domain-containing protein [Sphingobacterium endophyticum]|uniref:type IV toxin-antitoxin system AbiEi family antitoxin domain-containing protein n=1 Tax=Sphingobacterium endophyticum TaxID=2546448 RepID=UPI0012E2027F|nr:hypothetical protein [Sphingobacterium endophyticum]
MKIEDALLNFREAVLTRQIVLSLLKGYQRPNDKVSEMIKQGILIPLKNGLYIPGPGLHMDPPNDKLIANHLWGPSYVSSDSALSYWGMIPEKVFEVLSCTTKLAKYYQTPIGRFRYYHVQESYYSLGIKSVRLTERQTVFIASPEKALFDRIILTSGILLRSIPQTESFLFEDLRMDEQQISLLDFKMMEKWLVFSPKRKSLEWLLKVIKAISI